MSADRSRSRSELNPAENASSRHVQIDKGVSPIAISQGDFVARQLATLVRYARRQAGFTQRQVATRACISQGRISQIEKGMAEPTVLTIVNILEACGGRPYLEAIMGADPSRDAGVYLARKGSADVSTEP